jgi:hypothetical protein
LKYIFREKYAASVYQHPEIKREYLDIKEVGSFVTNFIMVISVMPDCVALASV